MKKQQSNKTNSENHSSIPAVKEEKQNYLLDYVWEQFEIWDETAKSLKARLSKWKKLVFIFVITGAVLGTIGAYLDGQSIKEKDWFIYNAQFFAGASTLFIALASFAGARIITNDSENLQLNARTAAETLKSESYRYLFSSTPYDENKDIEFAKFINNMSKKMSEIEYKAVTKKDLYEIAKKNGYREVKPKENFTIEDYIKERVDSQIDYYIKKVKEFQKEVNKYQYISFSLGFLGVILGTLASSGLTEITVVIALITSISASTTSYFEGQKYQSLIISYQATANRLKLSLAKFKRNDKVHESNIQSFVERCEDTLSLENSTWAAELTKEELKEIKQK